MSVKLKLGTRGSALALAQVAMTRAALAQVAPGLEVETVVIKTTGDRQSETGAPEAGKGVFVKEIEEALLARTVDVAVHSMKDLPTELAPGLALVAMLPRADVRDVFCSREGRILDELPEGATVATGSPRREAQLKRLYSQVRFVGIRGNVDTRLRKIREGEADGVVLARAGLVRLGLEAAITEIIPVPVCLPAPGQGAVGLEARADDDKTRLLLERVGHRDTMLAVRAERQMLLKLGGGCRTPIAAYGQITDGSLHLLGFVGSAETAIFVQGAVTAPADAPEAAGDRLAEELLGKGARELLAA